MTVLEFLAVAAGAFFGAIVRYVISKKWNRKASAPVGTLTVNLLGCLLIGLLTRVLPPGPLLFFLVTGFAGSLTTFSTWIKEILGMARLQEFKGAALYLAGSVLIGLLFVALGYAAGGLVVK